MFIDKLTITKEEALRRLSSSLEDLCGFNKGCDGCIITCEIYSDRDERGTCSCKASGTRVSDRASLIMAAIEFSDAGEEF